MACCSEYQTECLRVVTIGYLKSFIGSNIQNSSGNAVSISYSDNTYCPTYGELTGGTFIQNWAQGSTPNGDRDGIVVSSTCTGTGNPYANNQLVNQKDLSMRYTRFKQFTCSSPDTDVYECGGTEQLSYVHKYTRYVTSMNASCVTGTTSSEVSDTANSEVSWTPGCNWVSVNASTHLATVSTQPATRTAARRCCTVTGKVTFRTTDHTCTTDVCQEALTGGWVFSATSYYNLTVTASTSPVGCCGGEYGMNGTGYYFDRYFWKDSCNREYRESPFDDRYGTESLTGSGGGGCTSCTIAGDSTIGSAGGNVQLTVSESSAGGTYYTGGTFPAAGCCNDTTNCCTGRSDSASVTLTWHGLSETRTFTQDCPDEDSGCCPLDYDWDGWSCTSSNYGKYVTETGTKYKQKKDEYGICRRIPGDSGTATTRDHWCCISCSNSESGTWNCSGHEGERVSYEVTVTPYNPSSSCDECVAGTPYTATRYHQCDKLYPMDNHSSMSTETGKGLESMLSDAVAYGVKVSSVSGDAKKEDDTHIRLNCTIPSDAKEGQRVGSYSASFSGCGTKYYSSVSVTLYYKKCPGGCS